MTCDDYLKDPEANAAHLATCASCRALDEGVFDDLDQPIEIVSRPIRVESLPLASWEGASYRTWPLVAAGATAVLVLAIVLFVAAGTSPVRGITRAVTSGVTSFEAAASFFQLLGSGLHNAPPAVHVTVAVLFVVINTLLFLLLRRAPKGIDV
jgi:hypothetical protein